MSITKGIDHFDSEPENGEEQPEAESKGKSGESIYIPRGKFEGQSKVYNPSKQDMAEIGSDRKSDSSNFRGNFLLKNGGGDGKMPDKVGVVPQIRLRSSRDCDDPKPSGRSGPRSGDRDGTNRRHEGLNDGDGDVEQRRGRKSGREGSNEGRMGHAGREHKRSAVEHRSVPGKRSGGHKGRTVDRKSGESGSEEEDDNLYNSPCLSMLARAVGRKGRKEIQTSALAETPLELGNKRGKRRTGDSKNARLGDGPTSYGSSDKSGMGGKKGLTRGRDLLPSKPWLAVETVCPGIGDELQSLSGMLNHLQSAWSNVTQGLVGFTNSNFVGSSASDIEERAGKLEQGLVELNEVLTQNESHFSAFSTTIQRLFQVAEDAGAEVNSDSSTDTCSDSGESIV